MLTPSRVSCILGAMTNKDMSKWFAFYLEEVIGQLKWWANYFRRSDDEYAATYIEGLIPVVREAVEKYDPKMGHGE